MEQITDLTNEAARWDIDTLRLTNNTLVLKDVKQSGFLNMVYGYVGDCEMDVQDEWVDEDLKLVFSE